MAARLLRTSGAVAVGIAVWYALHQFAPQWAAALFSLVVAAAIGGVAQRYAPRIVQAISGDSPLGVIVGDDKGFYSDEWSVALPGDLLYEQYPPDGVDLLEARAQLVQLGAYDIGTSHLRLVLEGRSDRTVTVTGIRAHVLHRETPIAGTRITSPSAGQNQVMPLVFHLDQDDAPAVDTDGTVVFSNFVLTLAEGEVTVYAVSGVAETTACAWELEIDFMIGGTEHTIPVRRAGEPFRTTPKVGSYAKRLHWAWYEYPARLAPEPEPG